MKQFKDYSKYYDSLYLDKDYVAETDFILKLIEKYSTSKIENLLSLGCGTATYEILMAKKGFKIVGIDISSEMLDIAKNKIRDTNFENQIKVYKKDVCNFRFRKKFDVSMAMFNIVGYQNSNESFENMLRNVAGNLSKGGIFIFDCWYMPAVLKDRPTNRIKEVRVNGRKIVRKTKSDLDLNSNIIKITFNVTELVKAKEISRIEETHKMRYWSLPELKYFLKKTGFSFVYACNFMQKESEISDKYWNIVVIARRR